jgi:hypothetical protein
MVSKQGIFVHRTISIAGEGCKWAFLGTGGYWDGVGGRRKLERREELERVGGTGAGDGRGH